jgi:hypothetical protein
MGKLSRTKGQSAEREVCALLSKAFGFEIKRNLGQERDSGHDITVEPFHIEVKRRARIAKIYEWVDGAARPGKIPIVTLRSDRQDWLVIMRLSDWTTLAAGTLLPYHQKIHHGQ